MDSLSIRYEAYMSNSDLDNNQKSNHDSYKDNPEHQPSSFNEENSSCSTSAATRRVTIASGNAISSRKYSGSHSLSNVKPKPTPTRASHRGKRGNNEQSQVGLGSQHDSSADMSASDEVTMLSDSLAVIMLTQHREMHSVSDATAHCPSDLSRWGTALVCMCAGECACVCVCERETRRGGGDRGRPGSGKAWPVNTRSEGQWMHPLGAKGGVGRGRYFL